MVRHEAGEALGAIGDPKVIDLLKLYSKDECPEVAETCELALKRLEWLQDNKNEHDSVYDSVGKISNTFMKTYFNF
jgi:deoxyhypusine monooxygenase